MIKIPSVFRITDIIARVFCFIDVNPARMVTPASSGRGEAIRIPAKK